MENFSLRRFRSPVLGALVIVVLAVPNPSPAQAPAQTGSVSDEVARQKIAGQRFEAEVRESLDDAQRLAAREPARALDVLRSLLAKVEADTLLEDSRRATLIRVVKDRLRAVEADGRESSAKQHLRTVKRSEAADRADAEERAAKDRATIGEQLRQVRALQRAGRTDEAARLADDLVRTYPEMSTTRTARRSADTTAQVAAAREVRRESERRGTLAFRDVQKSAIPADGDIEFPKDWAERTKNRKSDTVRLTPKEQAIQSALNRPVDSVSFKNSRLEDVLDYLSTLLNQPIILDKAALDDLQLNYDTPVNLKMRNVAARTVLRKALADLNLTYIISDETIKVTSPQRARDQMITRTYYIGDVLAGMNPRAVVFGPAFDHLQMMYNAGLIIDMVKSSVDPLSWQDKGGGGAGAVTFNPATMTLIVRQSAEVHSMLAGSFSGR